MGRKNGLIRPPPLDFSSSFQYFEILSIKKRVLRTEKVIFGISVKRRIRICIKKVENKTHLNFALRASYKMQSLILFLRWRLCVYFSLFIERINIRKTHIYLWNILDES